MIVRPILAEKVFPTGVGMNRRTRGGISLAGVFPTGVGMNPPYR